MPGKDDGDETPARDDGPGAADRAGQDGAVEDEPEPSSDGSVADGDETTPTGDGVGSGDRAAADDDGTATPDGDRTATPDGPSTTAGDGPDPQHGTAAAGDDDRGPVRWFLTTDREDVAAVRDLVGTVAAVLMVGVLLFAISGIWPPLVAVESGSMEPHMYRGDLVFIVDEQRFSGGNAVAGTGVVTWRVGTETGYWSFGDYGNVIVFEPNGGDSTPIIHRARFWVENGENWVDPPNEGGTGKADPDYLGSRDDCSDLPSDVCPAPHDGFVTKGDANPRYDQVVGRSAPVKPEWIRGTAKVRVPYLGWVRLTFSGR